MRCWPTVAQVSATRDVVRWYLQRYFRTDQDPGTLEMFCDRSRVGFFAVRRDKIAEGGTNELFRLLVATTMFQRRQDVQVMRILRGIGGRDAAELTTASKLLRLVDANCCPHLATTTSLHNDCDLAKDPVSHDGVCGRNPAVDCHLKRHSVLLKRYGHFGKVPTSVALVIREAGAQDLGDMRARVFNQFKAPTDRAKGLEAALSKAWRINRKIASMFLSIVCNPDLSPGAAPWADGIDWTHFVVIDSNVDLFLASIGYRGLTTYDSRREFIRGLAHRIDLREMDRRLQPFNPRIVQQALFILMS